MKNRNKFLLIVLLCLMSHWALYGQNTTVMFLDVPGLDGEYEKPGGRTNVTTPGPKQYTIKIDSYQISKTNTGTTSQSAGGGAGTTNDIGSMVVSFHIDKAIVGLSERLFNHTLVPFMNLFIDSPGNPQRERLRIKMTDVSIQSITQGQDNDGIPTYYMTIRFRKNLTGVTVYDNANVASTLVYCWNYIVGTDNCPLTF